MEEHFKDGCLQSTAPHKPLNYCRSTCYNPKAMEKEIWKAIYYRTYRTSEGSPVVPCTRIVGPLELFVMFLTSEAHYPAGGGVPIIGIGVAMRVCIWAAIMFSWVIYVKVRSTWMPGLKGGHCLSLHLVVVVMLWLLWSEESQPEVAW